MPKQINKSEFSSIVVKGAKVHNLKNVDVEIPHDKLTVITGLSGSGKSSLAFDTIYAEGQRRYVESLSPYARQFLGLMERPDVDFIDGLSPAISIEQKSVSHNPRSTVGTVTEIYDYLRLLFAKVGIQYCVNCKIKVEKQSIDQIINTIINFPKNSKIIILAPVIKGRKGHYQELFKQMLKDGFVRTRIDGEIKLLEKGMKVDRYKKHNIEVVVDRLIINSQSRSRLSNSIELSLKYGSNSIIVSNGLSDKIFSTSNSCPQCNQSYEEPAPNSFSFNSPYGACKNCEGLGEKKDLSLNLIFPSLEKTINEGAIAPLGFPRETYFFSQVKALIDLHKLNYDTPLKKFPKIAFDELLNGTGSNKLEIEYHKSSGKKVIYKHRFSGIIGILQNYYNNTSSPKIRNWVESFMTTTKCNLCVGGRLKKENLEIKIEDKKRDKSFSIFEVVSLPLDKLFQFFTSFKFGKREEIISNQIIKEILNRVNFLIQVGLQYVTLDRATRTLSGGESQRIRLATQIGTQLVGVLYILDEPSIGLHQRDNQKLISSLKNLRDLGNTVIVVEHDKEMMIQSDYIIDLGPGAGEHGGKVIHADKTKNLLNLNGKSNSNTFDYISGKKKIPIPKKRRTNKTEHLTIKGASGNNLKSISLKIPLKKFVCITGVSGSGKSTLINETLVPVLQNYFYDSKTAPLSYNSIEGKKLIDKIIEVDQSPIGRTPRSNPATYTSLFNHIRDLFTLLPESQIRGYKAGRFSFNVKGGRCEECEGGGLRKIEMNFIPDVYVECELCGGKRYNRETLEVHFKGKSIADVLNMTVEEALEFFKELPRLKKFLETLNQVGLGYIRLGQQATTLSGGEAQRIKLATELAKTSTGKTLYVLDEPTTGLHFNDIKMLLNVLQKLVDLGNTVIVIEHNLDVIKTADWIIDLGPEGGELGGEIIAEGTPEEVARNTKSYTGKYLIKELN
ncbi:MAG: excinuclease ABC subunit UvrA [Bacteroidetes bacterium]|nr:excinuclease ABC subunit UvrA [Bacteroidota bacterium]